MLLQLTMEALLLVVTRIRDFHTQQLFVLILRGGGIGRRRRTDPERHGRGDFSERAGFDVTRRSKKTEMGNGINNNL